MFGPDYASWVPKVMYFKLLAKNVREGRYGTLGEFRKDFDLIWQNALAVNEEGSVGFVAGVKLRDMGKAFLDRVDLQMGVKSAVKVRVY